MGGGNKPPAAFQAPEQMGVDLNSSNYGTPIPLVYGQNKVSGNCCWYGDFSVTQTQQGGKGGGGGNTQYDYHSSYMLVICEGPITAFGNAWQGSSYQPLSDLQPAFTTLGTIGQAPWSHFGGVQALGYSGFALIAFLNNDLGGQASTPNYQIEVNALLQFGSGITDADPSAIANDICTNSYHGIGFAYLGSLTQWHDYCLAYGLFISPVYNTETTGAAVIKDLAEWTNTQVYFSEGVLKFVPYGDTAATANGATFTPNLTPVYNFTDADYVIDGSSPPVRLTRKALPDCMNTVRIQYPDRAYYYYDEMVEARDQEDAISNGVRVATSKRIDSITTGAVARFVAQNMLQRELYIRNTYEWSTSWEFAFLEPSDPVTITDSTMGFTQELVRITKVEEAEDGKLNFTAEELPIGVAHSANYNTQTNGGYTINTQIDPGSVETPIFFRAPGFLFSQDNPNIGIAVAGSTPYWGGAQVWISYDGTNYYYKDTILLQARYGLLDTNVAIESDPDTVSTPNVTLEWGELTGGSNSEADQLQTLFMLISGGIPELMSYGSATFVSGETYTLGYLRRGAYNSTIATHAIGDTFVRLDDSIFYLPIDPSYVGKTIYVKFLSYNVFGITPRTLASETVYAYVVGTNTNLPDVPDVPSSWAGTAAPDGVILTWTNDNPAAVAKTSIERSPNGSTGWVVLKQVGNAHESYHDIWSQTDLQNGVVYYYRARAQGALPQSGFSAYTSVINSAAFASSFSSVTGDQRNLIPDSDMKYQQVYWTPNSPWTLHYLANQGSWGAYIVGTGSAFGTTPFQGTPFPVSQGQVVTISCTAAGTSHITSGSIGVRVHRSDAVNDIALTITANTDGRQSAQYTIPTGVTTIWVGWTLNNCTISNGNSVFLFHPQCEYGPVMTGYRSTDDQNGYSIFSGSVPPNIATTSFTYTSSCPSGVGKITWSWSSFYYYNADGSQINVGTGSATQTSGSVHRRLIISTLYRPDGIEQFNLWVTGGSGTTGYAFTTRSSAAAATQNFAYYVPLSSGGIAAVTPASGGSGGGSGGGSACLHPETMLVINGQRHKAGLLRENDYVLTPEGRQRVTKLERKWQSEWVKITLNNGHSMIVTPTHRIVASDKSLIEASSLRIKSILYAVGELLVVTKLEYIDDRKQCVSLEVPCGFYYTELGGPVNKNGSGKP